MLTVNMKQMHRWVVNQDNVRFYNSIMSTNGKVISLDYRGYIEYLCEYNIFYTIK